MYVVDEGGGGSTEMYKNEHRVQAYDDMYDTEAPQPYLFVVLLLFV